MQSVHYAMQATTRVAIEVKSLLPGFAEEKCKITTKILTKCQVSPSPSACGDLTTDDMCPRTLGTFIFRSNADPTSVLDESLGYITGLRGLPAPETPPGVLDGGDVGGVDNGEPQLLPLLLPLLPPLPLLPLPIDPFDRTD